MRAAACWFGPGRCLVTPGGRRLRRGRGLLRPDDGPFARSARRRRLGLRQVEEQARGRAELQLVGLEQPDRAVLAVVSGPAAHFSCAQSGDGLGQQRAALAPDVLEGHGFEQGQFRPQTGQQRVVSPRHLLALRTHLQQLAQDFFERHQASKRRRTWRARRWIVRPVRELLHAVHHTQRDRLATLGTLPGMRACLSRAKANAALAMAVEVVLAFLGKELDGAAIAPACAQGLEHGRVRTLGLKAAGLASQLRRRMGIGVGHQGVAVQGRETPVHGRVGRQPGLHRKNPLAQIVVTLFDRVEARFRAQHREPGRPDVGGNQVALVAQLADHLQQVARIEPQDGTPVGGDIADPLQAAAQTVGLVQLGHVDQMVDLARALALLVDRGNLHLEHETHRTQLGRAGTVCHGVVCQGCQHLVAQPEQPGAVGCQLFSDLGKPAGVGKVAGAQEPNALAHRPAGQVLQVAVAAGGAGELGMDVKIGVEPHGSGLRARVCSKGKRSSADSPPRLLLFRRRPAHLKTIIPRSVATASLRGWVAPTGSSRGTRLRVQLAEFRVFGISRFRRFNRCFRRIACVRFTHSTGFLWR